MLFEPEKNEIKFFEAALVSEKLSSISKYVNGSVDLIFRVSKGLVKLRLRSEISESNYYINKNQQ